MAGIWSRATLARNPTAQDADIPSALKLLKERFELPDAWFAVSTEDLRMAAIGHGMPGREDDGKGDVIPGLMHLSMIAVEPDFWGRGHGRAMTEFAIERAKKFGFERVQLWTQISNERAIGLYESLGFRPAGREGEYQGEPTWLSI